MEKREKEEGGEAEEERRGRTVGGRRLKRKEGREAARGWRTEREEREQREWKGQGGGGDFLLIHTKTPPQIACAVYAVPLLRSNCDQCRLINESAVLDLILAISLMRSKAMRFARI